jgi:hypothetical protein
MIEPLDMLRSQWQTAKISGKTDEKIVISRAEKSNTQTNYNFTRKGVVKRNTGITNGDFITVGSASYFVIGAIPTQVKLREVNCTVDICKITKKYNGSKELGDFEEIIHHNIPAFYENINGNMKLYDSGLLPTTVKRFILLNDITVQNDYRIKLNGKNYKVNYIDDSRYPKLLHVQTENDNRVTK